MLQKWNIQGWSHMLKNLCSGWQMYTTQSLKGSSLFFWMQFPAKMVTSSNIYLNIILELDNCPMPKLCCSIMTKQLHVAFLLIATFSHASTDTWKYYTVTCKTGCASVHCTELAIQSKSSSPTRKSFNGNTSGTASQQLHFIHTRQNL